MVLLTLNGEIRDLILLRILDEDLRGFNQAPACLALNQTMIFSMIFIQRKDLNF